MTKRRPIEASLRGVPTMSVLGGVLSLLGGQGSIDTRHASRQSVIDWPGPILIVSPHLDDAALSCGVLLDGRRPAHVLSVFTAAPAQPMCTVWDRLCGFKDSAESIQARLAEDEQAFRGSLHEVTHLGLIDGQYRDFRYTAADRGLLIDWISQWAGNQSAPPLVLLPAATGVPKPAPHSSLLASTLSRARNSAGRLLGRPIGPKVHPDHEWTRDVGVQGALRADVTLGFYEDLPYLWGRPGAETVRRISAGLGRTASRQTHPVDRDKKIRRIHCYRSQIATLAGASHPLDVGTDLPQFEHYWLVS